MSALLLLLLLLAAAVFPCCLSLCDINLQRLHADQGITIITFYFI